MDQIYLAAPFFNPEQVDVLKKLEAEALRLGYDAFSPRIRCYCPPNASEEERNTSFKSNCRGIATSKFILARIDDFDPGTVWELGYAFALGVPNIYAYTTIPTRGLNLMLTQGVDGFLQGLPSVFKFLQEMKSGIDTEAKKWKLQIV